MRLRLQLQVVAFDPNNTKGVCQAPLKSNFIMHYMHFIPATRDPISLTIYYLLVITQYNFKYPSQQKENKHSIQH